MKLPISKGTEVYIDSSIFIQHHSLDLPLKEKCTNFLELVENYQYRAFISLLVIDEVTYILLKHKAVEILQTTNSYEILKELKKNKQLFKECWQIAQKHIDYVLSLKEKGALYIITQTPPVELFSSVVNEDYLFPRDATHLAIMKMLNISHIVSTDKDFQNIKNIKLYLPA